MSKLAIGLVIGASIAGAVTGVKHVGQSLDALKARHLLLGKAINRYNASGIRSVQKLTREYRTLGREIKAIQLTTQKQKLIEKRNAMMGETMGAVGAAMLFAAPVKQAISFESAMADVKKVVDFDTPAQFKAMQQDILGLTRTLPMSATELTKIAAAGGQLGIKRQDIKGFTEQIAKMSVAFDMSAEDSGDAMAKLANVYKIPIGEISNLGDAINDLSNSSPAKASEIVRVLGRVGGVAKQFGLTANAATALGGAFIALGKPPEVAGTAINGMLTKLMTADKQGKKFQKALGQMGMSATQLKTNIAQNGEKALVGFLKQLNKMPKKDQMGILTDLFGLEYGDDVAVLAGNVDLLEQNLNRLSGKSYLGSMEKEFQARAATTENNLILLKNALVELGISIGSTLLPIVNSLVGAFAPLVHFVASVTQQFPVLTGIIATTVAGVVALYTATKLVSVGLTIARVAMLAFSTAATINPIGLAVKAIAVAAFVIVQYWRPIKDFFIGLWNGITGVFSKAFSAVSNVISGIWDFIKSAFSGGIGGIARMILDFSPLGLFYKAFSGVMNFFGVNIPASFSNFGKMLIDGFVGGIKNAWGAVKDTVTNLGASVTGWFKGLLGINSPSRVFKGYGVNTVEGLAQGIDGSQSLAKNATVNLAKTVDDGGQSMVRNTSISTSNIPVAKLAKTVDERGQLMATNTTAGTMTQATGASLASGFTINFNPTINVQDGTTGTVNGVKTALKMSLKEFETLLSQVEMNRRRVAY